MIDFDRWFFITFQSPDLVSEDYVRSARFINVFFVLIFEISFNFEW